MKRLTKIIIFSLILILSLYLFFCLTKIETLPEKCELNSLFTVDLNCQFAQLLGYILIILTIILIIVILYQLFSILKKKK